jgi:uncharacterized protein
MAESPFDPFAIVEPEVLFENTNPSFVIRVFRNRFGHWRAGWRLLFYSLAIVALGVVISVPFGILMPDDAGGGFGSLTHLLGLMVSITVLLVAALAVLKWVDRRPVSMLGLGFGPGWLRELSLGVGAGVVMTGFVALVLVVSGSAELSLTEDVGRSLGAFPTYLLLFTLAGTVEELIFRGYPLQVLAEGSRRWIAVVVLSLPFMIAHFSNPDVTVIGALNIFLVGILLAVVYFETRRLWLPIGLHLSWNISQSWLWGFDVSGIKLDNLFFVAHPTGPEWLTGGGFGLEGSVVSSVLVAAITLWLLLARPLRPTAEARALWAPYPAGFGMAPEIVPPTETEEVPPVSEPDARSERRDTAIPADDEPSPF